MGHDKLRKFAENETFQCLLQPDCNELLADGFFNLRDHSIKGNWSKRLSEGPIILELGCGKGEYTIDLAQRNPDRNYIGVDIKGARLWKGAKFATQNRMANVAFLRTRVEFITAFFAPGEVSEVWLTFSDPQFKSANSRLSSPVFLERYRSFLRKGGLVHLKTDSRFLHEYTRAVCFANALEVTACTNNLYGHRAGCPTLPPENLGEKPAGRDTQPGGSIPPEVYEVQTFYEKMFLEQGYDITYMAFVIDHDGPFFAPREPSEEERMAPGYDPVAAVEQGIFDTEYWRSVEGPRLLFGHDSAETRRQKLQAGQHEL